MNRHLTLALLVATLGFMGCTTTDICTEAADHITTCTGEAPAELAQSCDPNRAETVLAQDCGTVRATAAAAGKADGWWSDFWCDLHYYNYCDPFDTRRSAAPKMVGTWKLESSNSVDGAYHDAGSVIGCPPELRVIAGHDAGKPFLGLREVNGDLRIYDRADLIDINGGESCESVDFSLTEALKVCHRSELVVANVVTHRVWLGKRVGVWVKFIPAGSSSATQTLTIGGLYNGIRKLYYEYFIDSELRDSCVFVPAGS
jgi:hypothetical protein